MDYTDQLPRRRPLLYSLAISISLRERLAEQERDEGRVLELYLVVVCFLQALWIVQGTTKALRLPGGVGEGLRRLFPP